MTEPCLIHGIEIPVGDPQRFISPLWYEVCSFYEQYYRICQERDIKPYDIQAYIWEVCRYLERVKARQEDDGSYRSASDWLKRLFEHWGISFHMRFISFLEGK